MFGNWPESLPRRARHLYEAPCKESVPSAPLLQVLVEVLRLAEKGPRYCSRPASAENMIHTPRAQHNSRRAEFYGVSRGRLLE